MPQQQWDNKRERQYKHIKDQKKERGTSEDRAEEIAARTVNKNRAQQDESEQQSKTSTEDIPPQRRGGIRSGNRYGPGGRTKDQLYSDAQREGIKGRSKMSKAQLEKALERG